MSKQNRNASKLFVMFCDDGWHFFMISTAPLPVISVAILVCTAPIARDIVTVYPKAESSNDRNEMPDSNNFLVHQNIQNSKSMGCFAEPVLKLHPNSPFNTVLLAATAGRTEPRSVHGWVFANWFTVTLQENPKNPWKSWQLFNGSRGPEIVAAVGRRGCDWPFWKAH